MRHGEQDSPAPPLPHFLVCGCVGKQFSPWPKSVQVGFCPSQPDTYWLITHTEKGEKANIYLLPPSLQWQCNK